MEGKKHITDREISSLRALHEVFAVELAVCLSEYLRGVVEVRLRSVDRVECSRLRELLSGPGIILISSPPLEGSLILWIEPSLLRPMLERLLGGEPMPMEGAFGAPEREAVRSILIIFLERLSAAWEVLGPISFQYREVEQVPSPEVPPGEPALLLDFEVRMGECGGAFHLSVPYAALSPLVGAIPEPDGPVNGGSQDLEVAAVLAEPQVHLGDLLLLRPGDIIDTGKPASECLTLEVNGEPRFLGQAEPSRGKLSFRITKRLPR